MNNRPEDAKPIVFWESLEHSKQRTELQLSAVLRANCTYRFVKLPELSFIAWSGKATENISERWRHA